MNSKYLIINADDFNLTDGVSRGILECYDSGVLTSTTVLMTLPVKTNLFQLFKSRPFLGKGIHLSLTLGEAVHPKTPFQLIRSHLNHLEQINEHDAFREYDAQIRKFEKNIGCLPTHVDTHHHIQHAPNILRAIIRISNKYNIPFRQFNGLPKTIRDHFTKNKIFLTHHLLEDLDASNHWTETKIIKQLKKLNSGITEIMCHPGRADSKLRKISGFNHARDEERKIFTSRRIKNLIKELNIKLIHFGDLKYFAPLFV